jgi:transcriptional regulator with XRE-family HTH domain
METGRKILNLRFDRKISQQDLARACGITPSALSKIEAGINSPRAGIIWRIARNLGVTVEYLLDEAVPYPYRGYSYRHDLLVNDDDPEQPVNVRVSREEAAFLRALRATNQVAREIVFAIPEVPVETLRLMHFLLHHAKIHDPTHSFFKTFESLLTSGTAAGAEVRSTRRKRSKEVGKTTKRTQAKVSGTSAQTPARRGSRGRRGGRSRR